MDTSSLVRIPGYEYNEYLLILHPNEDLRGKIMQIKKEFSGKYRAPAALASAPHITLVNFIQFKMIEERLIYRLKIIAAGYHAFTVELKNYGNFPSHTLFINVESKQVIQNLGKELTGARQVMTLNKDHKPHFIHDPHITIARKLLPWQYEKGWLEYQNRHFSGRFIADSMLLLKRPVDQKKYQAVQQFAFMNLPVKTLQGNLFG
jgi:2'-5' RNA ligase